VFIRAQSEFLLRCYSDPMGHGVVLCEQKLIWLNG
jgi:hypothetical protein